jgi:hypothetical protein
MIILDELFYICNLGSNGDDNASCLVAGVVTLMKDFVICEKDKQLTPEQAQILVSYLNFYNYRICY